MANWVLSVNLNARGGDLARTLRQSATNARHLGTAAKSARRDIRDLGNASQSASRHIRTLGRDAQTAARHVNRLGDQARGAGRQLNRYGDAARTAHRNVNRLGDQSRTAGRDLARMSGQINSAVRDLTRLAQAAQRASTHMGRVGGHGSRAMRQYANETGRARHQLALMAGFLSGGALVMGTGELVKMGNEYQQSMNTFGAVTGATQVQMKRAAATANQLGADLKLPKATAADAAESMVELAKAGFRTDQAISATRASLILASAANVNAADSARYLGDMMDQFGMGADQAGRAADILASTANNASGNIIDIYYAMKYAGPVAHGLGVDMQEAASAVGMLGKAGILGQTAGTTLRGMLANLAAPTPQMIQGLKAMGIEAWDAEGKFKGLRHVIDGLSKAQHKMSEKDFAAAVKKSMGKPAMSGAIALAHQGTDSFDAMMMALNRTGAASDIAAAKGKGLAGAMLQLQAKAKQAGLAIYTGMAPSLEFLTRGLTTGISNATPKIEAFFKYFNDGATLFGPDLLAGARKQFEGIGAAATDMAKPFREIGGNALAAALNLIINAGKMVIDVLKNLARGVEPVLSAFGDLAGDGKGAATALDIIVYALNAAMSAVSAFSGVLGPIGHLIGGLVSAFGALPGPIQSAVFAMLLMRRVAPVAQGLATTVGGRLTGSFRSLGEQMRVQRALAAASGQSLSRYGAAFAVLQTRVGVIGQMSGSFRTAAGAAGGLGGALRGVTAAAGTGLKTAMSGLVGVLGGPWGIALTAATVGLGLLASKQQKAAQAASEHEQRVSGLTAALRDSGGVIDDNVRAVAAQTLVDRKLKDGKTQLVDVMEKSGVSMRTLTDAYLGQGTSLQDLEKNLRAAAEANREYQMMGGGKAAVQVLQYTEAGKRSLAAADALRSMSGEMDKGVTNAKRLAEAQNPSVHALSAYEKLKLAVGGLADKTADADARTRSLRDALDLLSGGSVSLQAAQTRVNRAITQATEAMSNGIDKADGWGKKLVSSTGSLDTTTKNGQDLADTLDSIADASAGASIAAYDFAQGQKKTLPDSIAAARAEMQRGRDEAIKLAQGYGMSKKEAEGVADAMGLIPGQVSVLLQTQGVDAALAELLAVQAEFQQFPDKKTIKVDALGAEAKKELEDIGYKIKLIPGTREYKITAPTDAARAQLDLLVLKLGQTNGKDVPITASTLNAIDGLQTVQNKVRATKGKTITMRAPTSEARQQLEALGYKIKNTKGKNVTISVPTGSQRANIAALQRAINSLKGKSVTITTYSKYVSTGKQPGQQWLKGANNADGNIYVPYADGGVNAPAENHIAQIARPGTWRVWAEDETGGESYIPLAPAKRPRSRAIAEETVRRLGGDPDAIQWNADGRLNIARFADGGFSYTPPTARRGVSDVQSAYSEAHQPIDKDEYTKKMRARANAVDALRAAEARLKQVRKGKHTHAQLVAAEAQVSKARRNAATATEAARKAEARYKKTFSLSDWQKTLSTAVKANANWEANLKKIASRGGGEIIDQLREMGDEGAAMVAALAKSSNKQFNSIVSNLKKLAPLAKATLADYTSQLTASNKISAAFQANLVKLAGMGYGDLAAQLAGQGDEAAQKLAAEAVKSKTAASKANSAAKTADKQLSGEELGQLVQIIAAVKTSKTGIHQVADATDLGEDIIIAVANKASTQIKSSLGSRAGQLLADLARANKGLSYADGGIRPGIYSTSRGAVTFAEPSTGGEAYIPLGGNKRAGATDVLRDVAGRFGVGLTDAGGGARVVVIREQGPLVREQHWHINDRKTDRDLAARIDADNGYQMRRLARGGVAAR